MNYGLAILAALAIALFSGTVWYLRKIGLFETTNLSEAPIIAASNNLPKVPVVVVNRPVPVPAVVTTTVTPVQAQASTTAAVNPDAGPVFWDTPKHIYHAVRVMCDNNDLTVTEKNLLCACLYQESRFNNAAINHNRNSAGTVLSTDYGLCQINDFYHIGTGKDFPSVAFVLENPDKVFEWMIGMYKHGLLKQWVSYSSGAYKEWLEENSPMWALAD